MLKKLLLAATLLSSPAMAADLALQPYKAASGGYNPWFVYMGVEAGGSVIDHSFDFLNTGTGTVQVGGALAGALVGFEYKKEIMFRAEADFDYDFGKGSASCFNMGVACHLSHGGMVTERVDFGVPLPFFGGATPFVSAGAQQAQTFATVDGLGSANGWSNAFLAGAGVDVPAGLLSIGFRWDHLWPSQTISITPVSVTTTQSDVFKLNLKWRL